MHGVCDAVEESTGYPAVEVMLVTVVSDIVIIISVMLIFSNKVICYKL